jgi:phage recombination protein Bet
MENGKDLMSFDAKQVELIKKTVAKDANDLELQMFLHLCKQYALDPFLKEIYFMKRKVWNEWKKAYDEVPTMMVSRDGFLAIAHKSGQFGGMDTEAIYENGKLDRARCTVYNKSFTHPVVQSVLFQEYCVYKKDGTAQGLWNTKPETMIKKVAEAQALRKAFNVHGVYLQEEMESEIARDSLRSLDSVEDTLKLAETVHTQPKEDYAKWIAEVVDILMGELDSATNEQDIHDIRKKHKEDINNMQEEDRLETVAMIDEYWRKIVSGCDPEVIPEEKMEPVEEIKLTPTPKPNEAPNVLNADR